MAGESRIGEEGMTKALKAFSRDELREYVKRLGVKVGRNKTDVIKNLVADGRVELNISLRFPASTHTNWL